MLQVLYIISTVFQIIIKGWLIAVAEREKKQKFKMLYFRILNPKSLSREQFKKAGKAPEGKITK